MPLQLKPTHAINVHLASVWETKDGSKGGKFVRMLAWGDVVQIDDPDKDIADAFVRIVQFKFKEDSGEGSKPIRISGFIVPDKKSGLTGKDVVVPVAKNKVLRVNFVDVQQGDGAVIETPQGKVILVDGGENQLFARYLAGRFRNSSLQEPKQIDCIVVTHGDADHFEGLAQIHGSETHKEVWKRLFMYPRRVYHNGLVKRPGKKGDQPRKESEMLGATTLVKGRHVITGLVDDIRNVPSSEMNKHFKSWSAALATYEDRHAGSLGPIEIRRLSAGDDDAFDFIGEDIAVEVLGPLVTKVKGKPGLPFLGEPPQGPHIGHDPEKPTTTKFPGQSASHTINGHSIVFRMRYGKWRFLFAGDLNEESEAALLKAGSKLEAEVLKVPHHGSADFSAAFLKAVCPVVSVVSSGDENTRKDFIHPRATLVGALGRHSRMEHPLVFVTEMVAFFETRGFVDPECHQIKDGEAVIVGGKAVKLQKVGKRFFAFNRSNFGLVKVRTDGRQLLVLTDSSNVRLKEAYAYDMPGQLPVAIPVRKV
jgi:beta-lactamase superfamily II metal-dependent hydrolase